MSTAYMTPEQIMLAGIRERLEIKIDRGEYVIFEEDMFLFRGSPSRTSDFLIGYKLGRRSHSLSASTDTSDVHVETAPFQRTAEPQGAKAPTGEGSED